MIDLLDQWISIILIGTHVLDNERLIGAYSMKDAPFIPLSKEGVFWHEVIHLYQSYWRVTAV